MADLRFERTEKIIQLAFLELLKTTPYEKISIAKLAQVSMVDRTTFYAHFENLSELADTLIENALAPFVAAFLESKEQKTNRNFDSYTFFSHELVDHLLSNRSQIETVHELPLEANSFDHRLRKLFTDTYTTFLKLPETDFTIFLFVNLAMANFDFILKNSRVPSKKELQLGLKRMESFLK